MQLIKVLIVDDDTKFTRLVKTILERTGKYEVWEDNDGILTLDIARGFRPDLIFLDIQMPATSGAFVARNLRNDPGLKVRPRGLILPRPSCQKPTPRRTGSSAASRSLQSRLVCRN